MTDQPMTLSQRQQRIVAMLQTTLEGQQLPDIHAAMVCLYTQMIFMCAKTPRQAKVLANKFCEDIKAGVVNNMPMQKPVVVPETSGKAH